MNVILVTIGDELLLGQVVDTNSAWLGSHLADLGCNVIKRVSVPDIPEDIDRALSEAMNDAHIVISTGGLGPTSDDRTRAVLCALFHSKMVLHQPSLDNIIEMFGKRGLAVTDVNRAQAMVPEGADVLLNSLGTAPGLVLKKHGSYLFVLPGVPFEMEQLFISGVQPILKSMHQHAIVSRTIICSGIGESALADVIHEWEMALPKDLSLAYLPSPGIVRLRITGRGSDESSVCKRVEEQVEKLKPLIEPYFISDQDASIEQALGRLMIERKKTVATAESCTGGLIAHMITLVAGSSAYYKGSVIAYDNAVKIQELNVPADLIEQEGAVSEAVVKIMAREIRLKMGVDIGIAVSGIAGPGGGSVDKPVGTVWIALDSAHDHVARCFSFVSSRRDVNIKRAAVSALAMVIRRLL